jgi:hypothetical protein
MDSTLAEISDLVLKRVINAGCIKIVTSMRLTFCGRTVETFMGTEIRLTVNCKKRLKKSEHKTNF